MTKEYTSDEELLVGQVTSIFFENPSNFYKVIRVAVDDEATSFFAGSEMTCTGQFAALHLDTTYEFFGKLTSHPKYGEQFAVTRYQQVTPTSAQGMVDYLASDRFKGIGKVLAQRIVDTLGEQAIELIVADAEALKKVKGLTPAKRRDLRLNILQHQGTERIFMQLNEWGFGPKLAEKIYKTYKSSALDIIKNNPYELIEKIEGIGFNKADQLAEQLGIEAFAVDRLVASLITAVSDWCMSNGDTYVVREVAIVAARKLLEKSRPYLVEDELLETALDKALLENKLMSLAEGLMIPSLYHAEVNIANHIGQFMRYEHVERFAPEIIEAKIDEVVNITGIAYDAQQRAALKLAVESPMSIITGGPGTGKTTLIKGVIVLHALLHEYDLPDASKTYEESPILLAAPTGRAAKRMQEMTGLPASTIHRLIGYTRESSIEDFYSIELEGRLLIVDEMSMVDTWLMNWLTQAIPYHMQVIFVGDKDQLPSVGPGKVFSDLIESTTIPTISLTKIYRQSQDSSIIDLAHTIRQGYLPQNLMEKQADRSFIPCQANQVPQVIQRIVESALKKGYNATNLQVLAPMYKGVAGINTLNQLLQAQLNPPTSKKREIVYFEQVFRVGDKVLQLVNNADNGVYNGDIGKIEGIYFKGETESGSDELVVSFEDEKELIYKRGDFDQLTLAYCCSIHKSQGSEYPLVILPLVDMYSRMLRKNLVYTAVTRAKQSLVLIGNPNSFVKAVSQQDAPRQTFLCDLLQIKLGKKEKQTASLETFPPVANDLTHATTIEEDVLTIPLFDEPTELTNDTWMQIDAMIGMANITPWDFMEE
ncbi:ATP-dependent RecD-like DNA helicase [Aerococcaceae bacterium NML191292]|nr:ATP-dependent RecD-like DNA helicase [Aerococcaceae bacterium NML191292]